MDSSFGRLFSVTSFGESHGACVGVVVDGCPAGLPLAQADVQREVDKRRPAGVGATPRAEADEVEILSGVLSGHTTGAPLCLVVQNRDVDSSEYEKVRFVPRPGHADYTAYVKYGGWSDYRGGGRFSGRITASCVMAGAVARKLLGLIGVEVLAHTIAIGGVRADKVDTSAIRENVWRNPVRCADLRAVEPMVRAIEQARAEGDSLGGVIEGIALTVPAGLGEPVLANLDGELAKALFAIPAVKGVEFGAGFAVAEMRGSANNDPFTLENDRVVTGSNNAGGILGGISSGMPIIVRVAVKPTPTIPRSQETVNLKTMEKTSLAAGGRHDACIVPRAVVVVEAMLAITLCDFAMRAGRIPRVIR